MDKRGKSTTKIKANFPVRPEEHRYPGEDIGGNQKNRHKPVDQNQLERDLEIINPDVNSMESRG